MSKILIVFLFINFLFKCESSEDVVINIILENGKNNEKVEIKASKKTYINSIDLIGTATIHAKNINKEKATEILIGDYIIPVWLEPNKDFDVYVNLDKLNTGIEFYGKGAFKNELWNGKYLTPIYPDQYYLSEEEFREIIEKRKTSYLHTLDSLEIEGEFKNALIEKFNYKTFYDLSLYPDYYSSSIQDSLYFPTYGFYTYWLSYFPDKKKEANTHNYNHAFYKWVSGLSFDLNNIDSYHQLKQRLEYVDKNISNQQVKDFLTDRFTVNYINEYGIDSLEIITKNYNFRVTDRELRLQFETLVKDWQKLEKGKPAPDFSIQILDTSDITLKDFSGKYLYMYVWDFNELDSLTHIRNFNTLANRLKGYNINFLNIAVGEDKETWEQFIEQNQMEGITLYMDYNNKLLDNYIIFQFPVAILIDREGKIVNPRMSIPENSETIEALRKLFWRPTVTE